MTSFKDKINQVGLQAKEASKILAKIPANQKNEALLAMADHIQNDKELILEANKIDIEQAKAKGLSESLSIDWNLMKKELNQFQQLLEKLKTLKTLLEGF